MANYISENDIEQECIPVLMNELGYDEHLNLWQLPDDGNAVFGRSQAAEVVRSQILQASLHRLNPAITADVLTAAEQELTQSRAHLSLFDANQAITKLLREGFDVPTQDSKGNYTKQRVRYIDYQHPANNHFCVVQQLTIRGKATRRPDLIVYINGLPMVFVELKNAVESTRQAYDKNLTDYKRDIPTLFHYNLVVVLSNSTETKVGSHTADYEQFFNWEKISDESESTVPEHEIDLLRVLRGLFQKHVLIDLLENFVLFYANRAKIIAKNHQYLGVNNAIESFRKRDENKGKLGVFWHTQGSGKSFSMAFFVQKIQRKIKGQFKFVIVTDREDLEDQIYKTFVRTHLIETAQGNGRGKPNAIGRAPDGASLVRMLTDASPYVFTLINKFRTNPKEKGKPFPELTSSTDIVVLVDEAHRSQYADLGENMHRALPRANYIAFTGTPLLDADEKTKEWFGDYVSRYDFADSVADGSTVPIFYQNRVPKVLLQNDTLNEEYAEILEDENLSDEQQERLTRQYANVTTVITDNDRLDTIAKDIVAHFPERGYLGKGMVISIDKFTAVRMHDKVKRHWEDRIKELRGQINKLPVGSPERTELDTKRKWMRETELCVVVSYEADEDSKFSKEGLDIRPHRDMMNRTWGDDHETIEDRFRNPADRFRLAFVCAKWLTGFDAPTISTLYLDKPMQNHTLMQTIARANRVAPALADDGSVATANSLKVHEKKAGVVVDYIGVFTRLEKALAKYARSQGGKSEYPAEVFDDLLGYLNAAITEAVRFMDSQGLPVTQLTDSSQAFDKLAQFQAFSDALSRTEELKKEFSVYQTAITSFYEACKPDILTESLLPESPYRGKYKRIKEVFEYLRKIISRQVNHTGDYENAQVKASQLIDESIVSTGYSIESLSEIDLSGIDFDLLQQKFQQKPYKHLAITDMVDFLRNQVQKLLSRNVNRVDLAQKLNDIIANYNNVSSDVQAFFKALKEYAEQLREEEKRAAAEGLTEEELEIFDLLFKDELSPAEKTKVKAAAQHLLQKLQETEVQRTVLTVDWYKDVSLQGRVKKLVGDVLDSDLPDSYDRQIFTEKRDAVYQHVYQQAAQGRVYWA
ncbi:type I restriction endonuclease subunit R [Spirosoma sordidisoli]|uniref:Type I restriction enzyme endonuclease subunit n=1 Tax=Spirosoma sordidisoli TaxID=2502893 RepID=A0A4Q2UKH5_9BACT|nr:type I restriction endonuclease subunit R [Spirosoma sordidisoli]RYC70023.1 HsdR family type I site-specific deoxyribonuclease [Spirosoma sordidisoli]